MAKLSSENPTNVMVATVRTTMVSADRSQQILSRATFTGMGIIWLYGQVIMIHRCLNSNSFCFFPDPSLVVYLLRFCPFSYFLLAFTFPVLLPLCCLSASAYRYYPFPSCSSSPIPYVYFLPQLQPLTFHYFLWFLCHCHLSLVLKLLSLFHTLLDASDTTIVLHESWFPVYDTLPVPSSAISQTICTFLVCILINIFSRILCLSWPHMGPISTKLYTGVLVKNEKLIVRGKYIKPKHFRSTAVVTLHLMRHSALTPANGMAVYNISGKFTPNL